MKNPMRGNQNSGFTVVEGLAAAAITMILLGISMIAVVRYRDLLKITELDNAAREIYMAAENRAVLLSGSRRLNSQVDEAGTAVTLSGRPEDAETEELYYVSKTAMTEDLLTAGSVDPALREGDFYIVYDRNSGSVTDVFYAEEAMDALMAPDFAAFYDKWAKSRSERLKLKREMLVGWYNGQAAQGADIELEIPEEPAIKVMIQNGEELTVTVEYTAPGEADLSVKLGNIDLTNGTYNARKRDEKAQTGFNGIMYSCTWVLDSLTEGQFKGLGSGVNPGEDFTVTATIAPKAGASFAAASDSDENNSLFQEGSGGGTAYVKYLRHLQNLDTGAYNSGVKDKTAAIQTAGILCKGNETYGDYDFIPLYNARLERYDGRTNEIRGLYVSGKTFLGNQAHAGLFSRTGGGTSNRPMTFQNIRLVNASVTAAGDCYAGALVGSTSDPTIQNCWVYWEPDGDVTDLKGLLGSDAEGAGYQYQIVGRYAGGLVGYSKGNCAITGSLAATLVSGTECAGGLLGEFDGGTAAIQYSYADCYLTGDQNVAGLIGNLESGTTAKLGSSYAAGYILGGSQAAGLCLGTGGTTAENVYSAMRYPSREIKDTFTFLTQNQANDTFTETHFLGKDSQQVETKGGIIKSSLYADMTSGGFVSTMGGSFERKTPDDSHPYNLREHLFLNVYSYPGLKNMPHYGDWGAEFKEPSLVYYEQYSDGVWGVSGGNARDLVNSLEDNKSILSDGYAVAFLREDLKADSVEVTYTYLDEDGAARTSGPHTYRQDELTPTRWANDEGSLADYYMIPLPDELVNSGRAQDCFYQYLRFELVLSEEGEQPSGEYFFNPHFAETVNPVVAEGGSEGGWTKETAEAYARRLAGEMGEVKIRTPRHLYGLSQFKEYYTRRDTFHQILDLDYSAYTGYGGKFQGAPYEQQPIGRWDEAFVGTYNGDYNVIQNVVPSVNETAQRRYAGLFGYSTGTLRNIVYEMDPDHQVTAYLGSTANSLYVGALAGGNGGIMYNCAVSGANLRAGASGVRLYVGGLAGQNQGTIQNCAAESAQLSANCFNYASIYIGGLVGENTASRSVSTSYAVGRINVEADNTIQIARICGFVGWNYGTISNSYAAVDLQSSGENVEAYGFCGMRAGTQSGTGYLDQGNFAYRGTAYAANYHQEQDKAESVTYARLSGADAENAYTVSGMGRAVRSPQRTEEETELLYPYPAAVRDQDGSYIHYGRWPEPMPLGEMGVFYWEKLVIDGRETYHMSALAVDPQKQTITKQTTLSQVHNDGGVVTDYGYGYYSSREVEHNVSLSVNHIGYTDYLSYTSRSNYLALKNMEPESLTRDENSRSGRREADAEQAFADMIDGYAFHCWNTFREAPRKAETNDDNYRSLRAVSGLCLFKESAGADLDPNSGTFTLTQEGTERVAVKFVVNPQFADALSVADGGGLQVGGGASRENPGTKNNPYQIRCGVQLQDINWYDTAYTDVPVGFQSYQVQRFPYLSGEKYERNYYWEQTHDIDWVEERRSYDIPNAANDDGVFFPIAQVYASGSSLPGWFGGSYDGGNYTIKSVNIGINTANYNINSMGLFGAVRNATLKNIVMYSETGDDVVTVRGRNTGGADAWYAGGVLAGVALNSEISNCAAAGYTVRDETGHTRYLSSGWRPSVSYDVGGAIGGLVGMTNKDLTGCTAATRIEISCDHSGANESAAPIRTGGLVGSTTASVTNCYTGGQIIVSEAKDAAVYAGRLIGGVGMEPFGETADSASIENCYSYLTLPQVGGVVKEVYHIGGAGRTDNRGTVALANNYYLSGTADNAAGQRAITYQQLAGKEPIDGRSIYEMLNAGQNPGPYSPVTSEIGGLAMAGRFSYAPKNRLDLQGMDYPFPTVLTQTRVSDGMVFRVHYGGWTLNGIERENGGQPVELDMFTRREHAETLKISAGIPAGGEWSAEVDAEGIVEASLTKDGELTLTARKASDTPVTVTAKYTAGGAAYFLPITVNVTANLELRPGTVSMFPNDVVSVELIPYGIVPGTKEVQALANGNLEILEAGSVSPPVSAEAVMPPEDDSDGKPGVRLARTGEEAAEAQMWLDVTYTYTQEGYPETEEAALHTHRISVNLLDLPEGAWDRNGRVWSIDFKNHAPTELEAEIQDGTPDGFLLQVNGSVITLLKVEPDAEFPEGVKLRAVLTIDGLTHELTIALPPRPEGAEGQDEDGSEEEPNLE